MSNLPLCSLPRDKSWSVELSNSFLDESKGKAVSTFKMTVIIEVLKFSQRQLNLIEGTPVEDPVVVMSENLCRQCYELKCQLYFMSLPSLYEFPCIIFFSLFFFFFSLVQFPE